MHWIPYGLCGYAAALAVQFVLMPPDWNGSGTMVPYLAMPILTIFAELAGLIGGAIVLSVMNVPPTVFWSPRGAWIGSGDWWWLLKVLPLYAAHLWFFWGLLSRPGLVKSARHSKARLMFEFGLVAVWSALGVWFAVPVAERIELHVGDVKLPGDPVRLAVVSDLHSCRYGDGQRGLVELVES